MYFIELNTMYPANSEAKTFLQEFVQDADRRVVNDIAEFTSVLQSKVDEANISNPVDKDEEIALNCHYEPGDANRRIFFTLPQCFRLTIHKVKQ